MTKILYSSDLHGNQTQYQKMFAYAQKISVDVLILSGDIAPKNFSPESFIAGQRDFFKNTLPEMFTTLHTKLPKCKIFLMMGNDDASTNMNTLSTHDPKLYRVIHGKRINLTKDFDIVGYSHVPITPFGIKDWEKFDLSAVPTSWQTKYTLRKRTNYRLDGFKSTPTGWEKFKFNPSTEKEDSIQKDLENIIFTTKPKRTICIIHTPPDNTCLDQIYGGQHVGSMAVRSFIEEKQPYLTLHGHIHETVEVSGNFKEKIGNTLSLCSGNHNVGVNVAVISFDLKNPAHAKRILL